MILIDPGIKINMAQLQ